jgi:hypothetical protein
MANIRIIIDNVTAMDSEVTLRQGDLPTMENLRTSLETAAGGQFKPWQLPTVGALSAVLLEANTKGSVRDTTITVTTHANGWTLGVEHAVQQPN